MVKIELLEGNWSAKMHPIRSLYRSFLEKRIESSWNSGFFWGAITGSLAITYVRNREKLKHTIPQHTGDDCVYCKEYSQKKSSILQ